MKSSKSPRMGLTHRSRSSRSIHDHHPEPKPAPPPRRPSDAHAESVEERRAALANLKNTLGMERSRDEAIEIESMKRKMGEALALRQQQKSAPQSPPAPSGTSASDPETGESDIGFAITQTQTGSEESLLSGTLSTDSAKTLRGPLESTPGAMITQSYPFPRMHLQLNRGSSHRSAPSHKPFTLLSPTGAPLPTRTTAGEPTDRASSSPDPTIAQDATGEQRALEDANYPAPDLYDTILALNTEAGLDAWWANVSQVLTEAYGAERASLAVPGDLTDLENVPWGQKATFSLYGTDSDDPFNFGDPTTSEVENVAPKQESLQQQLPHVPSNYPRRPGLVSRHSIAGIVPEKATRNIAQRPPGPTRAVSTLATHHAENTLATSVPRFIRQSMRLPSGISMGSAVINPLQDSSASVSSSVRCVVHRSLQPLEAEGDALLVRTGVASLFGKRRPVVLTRAYTDPDSRSDSFKKAELKSRGTFQSQASASNPSAAIKDAGQGRQRVFDEYLQPEPSPWSQSPAPSPAARPDPQESPFFTTAANLDETAFDQAAQVHDYGVTANQSLGAIGADCSKTVVHIPLIPPVARGLLATSLRFPVAILSILSPINPYPRNLRESLTYLLPHLASSYSLAQQYSLLQDRLRGPSTGVHSGAFGLGGTFSDEGSELELVAELSEQVVAERGKELSPASQSVATSPGDQLQSGNESRPGSVVGTPLLEHLGLASGRLSTPGKSGTDMIDSYFTAKKQKSGSTHHITTPGGLSSALDFPDKVRRSEKKPQTTPRSTSKKTAASQPKIVEEHRAPAPARSASLASESDPGDLPHLEKTDQGFRRISFLQESAGSLEKPLPELISQLLLNSVPLQLFLAKPGSGDLVWTNRKFDAFRSQGEERVRDPWKNVHPDERPGLVQGWNEALKSGSQLTHYVRVKRFNSDSDYRWFIFRGSTLLSNTGRLLYWIGSFLDVHEQYMKSLEASEKEAALTRDAKLRALADSIPQILFEAVEGEGIVAVNRQWHFYSGQTLNDVKGLGFARQVHRDDLYKCGLLAPADGTSLFKGSSLSPNVSSSSTSSDKTAEPLPKVRTNGWNDLDATALARLVDEGVISVERDENGRLFYTTELRLRSKGGEYRWFLVRLVKVESELINGGRTSWYGTCTDIETRKALERELSEANERIHREMESKTKFFANMSHEIRTPLNGILGSMPWLVESSLDHDQRRTVDMIQNSSNNLRELVDNILDVTKVEAGKMTLQFKWFHVRTLLEEVIDTISSRAIERGLELNYTVDSEVPSSVKGDHFRVRQILLNLMGNSVKFTEQGEVYTRCYLYSGDQSANAGEGSVLLAFDVTDTGRGFNAAESQRIFQQFGQIGSSSNHDAGSGLGLFLSKQLAEMHGGQLSARSKTGEGSTFSFFIRVEVPPPGVNPSSPPPSRPGQHRASTSYTGSPRSRPESKTPTLNWNRASLPSSEPPAKVVASPGVSSSPVLSPSTSDPSVHSQSINVVHQSHSSLIPTPESITSAMDTSVENEKQASGERVSPLTPYIRRVKSDYEGNGGVPDQAHPTTYSIIVICPAEFARAAIKQHIEQVVPHQIPANVTTISDIGVFLEFEKSANPLTFTHVVLDLPASSDVMLILRQMSNITTAPAPDVIVITDHYQKRDIQDDFNALAASGRKVYMIHKPVKPAVFAMIFDPTQQRNLSKDAARSMAQTSSDDFKNAAARVRETIGNRSFRVLLVEDSDTNRRVIQKYLNKVDLVNESAQNGEECTEMVFSKPYGYYSLIICDIQMPKKNGYDACREIRQWEASQFQPPLPIMALTAHAMPEERAAAAQAGFTDYLTKPVNFTILGTMMMTLLDPKIPHVFLRDRPPES